MKLRRAWVQLSLEALPEPRIEGRAGLPPADGMSGDPARSTSTPGATEAPPSAGQPVFPPLG